MFPLHVQLFEKIVKNKNTLCDLRQTVKDTPDLGDALRDSMSGPILSIGERFQRMEIKGNAIKLGVPATELQMEEQFKFILDIEPSHLRKTSQKRNLEKPHY